MLKILLCVLIVLGCGYMGFSVSRYYIKREKFFSDFIDFLNHAKTQISFFQSRLAEVFTSFSCSGDMAKILAIMAARVKGEEDQEPKKPIYLNDNEWTWICGFLYAIGKCDLEREVDSIINIQEKANAAKINCQKDVLKKGSAATKLGVLLGLSIAILVI